MAASKRSIVARPDVLEASRAERLKAYGRSLRYRAKPQLEVDPMDLKFCNFAEAPFLHIIFSAVKLCKTDLIGEATQAIQRDRSKKRELGHTPRP